MQEVEHRPWDPRPVNWEYKARSYRLQDQDLTKYDSKTYAEAPDHRVRMGAWCKQQAGAQAQTPLRIEHRQHVGHVATAFLMKAAGLYHEALSTNAPMYLGCRLSSCQRLVHCTVR